MKKYILGSLLGLFSLVGTFASADTVGNFNSNSTIHSIVLNSSNTVSMDDMLGVDPDIEDFYMCISTNDIPYHYYYSDGINNDYILVSSSNYCSSTQFTFGDNTIYFYSIVDDTQEDKYLNGTFYFSSSPITYSSGGGDINEDDNGNIISSGISAFGGIIDKLGNLTGEFVPYLIYIAIGIMGISLIITTVKALIRYIKVKNMNAFYIQRFDNGYRKDGVFHAKFKRIKRKKIKRNYIRRFR